jgi:hypothetical protein
MRGLRTEKTAQGSSPDRLSCRTFDAAHYELGIGAPPVKRVAAAITELAQAI